jgi:hypothetical protein
LWHVSPSKIGILVWFGDFIQGTEWRTIVIWHDDWPPNSQFDPENSLYSGMIDHHLNMIHELRYCVYIYIKILYKYIYILYTVHIQMWWIVIRRACMMTKFELSWVRGYSTLGRHGWSSLLWLWGWMPRDAGLGLSALTFDGGILWGLSLESIF